MPELAAVSDKIVSPGQMWAVMGTVSIALGLYAIASRSWHCLVLGVPVSVVGCVLTLSLLDDPIFGDAVLQENGWPWFAANLCASMMPVATVLAVVVWRRFPGRLAAGFPLDEP